MDFLKGALFAVAVLFLSASAANSYPQLIHFLCKSADEVPVVVTMHDAGELVYGVTVLPGTCVWSMNPYPDVAARVGDVGKIIEPLTLSNGDTVWVGEITMHDGKIFYSAGYFELVS